MLMDTSFHNARPSLNDGDIGTYELTREKTDKESNIEIACTGGKGKVPLPQDMSQKEINEFRDIKTVYQTHQTDKDLDKNGYLLPQPEVPLNDEKSVSGKKKNGGCRMDMPNPLKKKQVRGLYLKA